MKQRTTSLILSLTAAATVAAGAVGIVAAQRNGGVTDPTVISAPAAPAHGISVDSAEYITALAGNLGITEDQLRDALAKTSTDLIDQALAGGDITQEQADALKEHVEGGQYLFGAPRLLKGFDRGWSGSSAFPLIGRLDDVADAVATYLGVSTDDLMSSLADGQSLAEIATANSKDVEGLKTVIRDAAKAELDEGVADGDLEQADADDLLSSLDEKLDDIINGALPGMGDFRLRGFREFHGHHHRGFFFDHDHDDEEDEEPEPTTSPSTQGL
jgi:hypothetical protein